MAIQVRDGMRSGVTEWLSRLRHGAIAGALSVNLWFVTIFVAVSTLVRIALMVLHYGEIADAWYRIPAALAMGFGFDLFVGAIITAPMALFLLVLPRRWLPSWPVRWLFTLGGFGFVYGLLYSGVAELFFFGEFSSRFNYVAVDYLVYPHEVFVNIWETYPVARVLIGVGLVSLAVLWLGHKRLWRSLAKSVRFGHRAAAVGLFAAVITAGALILNVDSERVSENRELNEMAGNGLYSLVYAGLTNELDYNQYYARLDRDQAFARVRQLLSDRHAKFTPSAPPDAIDRRVVSDRPLHRYNVVLILDESFGSNFIGTLHPTGPNLTPQFDRLAAAGMLFSHVYASGNRTVRGLEATMASFPPIPGRSIVKRPGSEHIFTLPALLRREGYHTVFLYGGHAYFDNFRHFAATNDFEKVIDQSDIDRPVFTTIWGVSDEDLYNKGLATLDSLETEPGPFFATFVTVSNHTPYTYPAGRIAFDPEERRRDFAVRYADHALGKFIDDARSHDFFDSTLFVFMADHGARVYGSQQIPLESYEIPLLFYCPALIPTGERLEVLGSQIDVAPTLLDFLGIDYNSEFYGRSLLATAPEASRALMSHDRDVALLQDGRLAVLGIMGTTELWQLDSASDEMHELPLSADSALVSDAIAYYMTAYDLYESHRLHPLPQAGVIQSAANLPQSDRRRRSALAHRP